MYMAFKWGNSNFWRIQKVFTCHLAGPHRNPRHPPATGQRHGLDLLLQRFSHLPLVVSSRLNGCLDMEPAGKRRDLPASLPFTHRAPAPGRMAAMRPWRNWQLSREGTSARSTANLKLKFSLWSSGLIAIPGKSCDLRPLTLLNPFLSSWRELEVLGLWVPPQQPQQQHHYANNKMAQQNNLPKIKDCWIFETSFNLFAVIDLAIQGGIGSH